MTDTKYEVSDGKLIIPNGVTEIYKDSIDGYLGSVKELVIPESVQHISAETFADCTHLEKVTIPARFICPIEDYNEAWSLRQKNINTISKFCAIFGRYIPKIDFITFIGDGEFDFSLWNEIFHSDKMPIICCTGDITKLKIAKAGQSNYKFFINNYIEDVDVQGTDKWTDEDLFFRAPKSKENIVEGDILNLTLCPRSTFYDDKRWSAPIAIKADTVTYVYPKPLQCYENEYEGCRLLLLGNRLEEIAIDDFSRMDGYPYVDVWERYDIVLNALRDAGWNKK